MEELFRRHATALTRYAARRIHDPAAAEDIVAATFLAAIESADSYDESRGTQIQWLYGIAGNLIAGHHRKTATATRAMARLGGQRWITADEFLEVHERVDAQRRTGSVATVVAELPPAERDLAVLIAEDLTVVEAAEELGIRPGTARMRLARIRQRLTPVLAGVAVVIIVMAAVIAQFVHTRQSTPEPATTPSPAQSLLRGLADRPGSTQPLHWRIVLTGCPASSVEIWVTSGIAGRLRVEYCQGQPWSENVEDLLQAWAKISSATPLPASENPLAVFDLPTEASALEARLRAETPLGRWTYLTRMMALPTHRAAALRLASGLDGAELADTSTVRVPYLGGSALLTFDPLTGELVQRITPEGTLTRSQ